MWNNVQARDTIIKATKTELESTKVELYSVKMKIKDLEKGVAGKDIIISHSECRICDLQQSIISAENNANTNWERRESVVADLKDPAQGECREQLAHKGQIDGQDGSGERKSCTPGSHFGRTSASLYSCTRAT